MPDSPPITVHLAFRPDLAAPASDTGNGGSGSGTPVTADASPITVNVAFRPDLTAPAGPYAADAPPITVHLAFRPDLPQGTEGPADPTDPTDPVTPVVVDAPPVKVSFTIPGPTTATSGLTLSQPDTSTPVRTARPTFAVTTQLSTTAEEASYIAEMQYAADAAFTNPTTLRMSIDGTDGGATFTPATDIPSPVWWRARLLHTDGSEFIRWTSAATFSVTPVAAETSTLALIWTVDANAARPAHLWHVTPAGPLAGETVTAYGQGFPDNGHLYFADQPLTSVTSWTRVPATADNASTTRTIAAAAVTPEHYEVVFTAPAYNGPGAALTVEA